MVGAASAAASPVILDALLRLGSNLIPIGHETEAAAHLEAALALARQLGERDQEISALLHLGTARQHLGERERAQVLFQAGLTDLRSTALTVTCITCCITGAAATRNKTGSRTPGTVWSRR